jgi:hypothetical protein
LFYELSAWFRAGSTVRAAPAGAFAGPADAGWAAAAAVSSRDESTQVTAAGLPRRRPQANLVPGSVGGAGAEHGADAPVTREAGTVRDRLSSLQRGVRAGRLHGPESVPSTAPDRAGGPGADDEGADEGGAEAVERDAAGGRHG